MSQETVHGITDLSFPGHNSDLSLGEALWLDLIEATVHVVKNATALLAPSAEEEASQQHPDATRPSDGNEEITKALRGLVQETFTALLTSTTAGIVTKQKGQAPPSASSSNRRLDLSFLRILRAFLARASVTHSSLAELRAVLTSIFSAYTYEESVLSLSNKLLQDDLFVSMEEVNKLRQRGWRPKSQLCEGCGKRVWGPGAGGKVWEAWRVKSAESRDRGRRGGGMEADAGAGSPFGGTQSLSSTERSRMKGKAIDRSPGPAPDNTSRSRTEDTEKDQPRGPRNKGDESKLDDSGIDPLVVFNCGHVYHQTCFDRLSRGASTTTAAPSTDRDKGRQEERGGAEEGLGSSSSAAGDGSGLRGRTDLAGDRQGSAERTERRCVVCSR